MKTSLKKVKGINILNPVDVDREYYLKAIDYAIENKCNHIQLNGPIHNMVKSNLDGMIFYRKYSQFNEEKDVDYVNYCIEVVNEALEKSHQAGIKTYMWHHELEIPTTFGNIYPEILNEYGDVEVSHPRIKDFLENKIEDFFEAYPLMDGFVLTYYETKVPLLRLKQQKLTTEEIMTYITKILYDACKSKGKEIIVRTDATIESDYKVLLNAYEKVATEDMMIMDKWTQYDWSLTLPSNYFIRNIKKNPLLVETDIFGEYFGKGKLPLMLKEHLKEKFEFCEQYSPVGYCSRIDRGGHHAFGTVNEINLHIMNALLNNEDVEAAVDQFFRIRYGKAGNKVMAVMEKTEGIVKKMLFANGYYYSELSWFPSLNHCKNHFYFELMREKCKIASNEWFIPPNYERGDVKQIFKDLNCAKLEAEESLRNIVNLKDEVGVTEYKKLFIDFKNLALATKCWCELANVFFNYIRYLDEKKDAYKKALNSSLLRLAELDQEGRNVLGNNFYCNYGDIGAKIEQKNNIQDLIAEVRKTFEYEEKMVASLEKENLTDFIVCGGASEGHELKKEVNFSDTLFIDGALVRIPGNRNGMNWSTITAHGWFSYRIKLKKNEENKIHVIAGSSTDRLKMKVSIGKKEYMIDKIVQGRTDIVLKYHSSPDEECTEMKLEKISANMPMIYMIKVQ